MKDQPQAVQRVGLNRRGQAVVVVVVGRDWQESLAEQRGKKRINQDKTRPALLGTQWCRFQVPDHKESQECTPQVRPASMI